MCWAAAAAVCLICKFTQAHCFPDFPDEMKQNDLPLVCVAHLNIYVCLNSLLHTDPHPGSWPETKRNIMKMQNKPALHIPQINEGQHRRYCKEPGNANFLSMNQSIVTFQHWPGVELCTDGMRSVPSAGQNICDAAPSCCSTRSSCIVPFSPPPPGEEPQRQTALVQWLLVSRWRPPEMLAEPRLLLAVTTLSHMFTDICWRLRPSRREDRLSHNGFRIYSWLFSFSDCKFHRSKHRL